MSALATLQSWCWVATAFASLIWGIFVYARDRKSSLHQAWVRLSLAIAFWSLAMNFMVRSFDPVWALIWARVGQVALSLTPLFFLQFSVSLIEGSGSSQRFLRWNLRLGSVFALLALFPLMIRGLQTEGPFPFYPLAGPFYGLFVVWFIGLLLACLKVLLKAQRDQIGPKRNQLRYVSVASVIGLLAFVSMMPLTFGIRFLPRGELLLVFYALISYSIVRWRLMDISIVVKNTLIYAGLYSILVGLFVVVVVFLGQWFFYGPQALDKRVLWMCVVALSIVTLLVRPLDTALRRLTDRVLFQRKYEWQKTLREASKGMAKVTSVERLLKLMAHFIAMRVRVTHVGILHQSSDFYTLKVSRGREKRPVGLVVQRDNPLAGWLEEKKELLTMEEVYRWLRNEKMFPHRTVIRRILEELKDEMEKLGAAVCVPAFSKSRMQGFLVLGEKLSGDSYTQEDLDVLATLVNEGAVALENAQLYEQLVQRMGEIESLYQREHRLFIHTAIALAAAVDARDPYTHGHTERCTSYAMTIAEELGVHPEMAVMPRFKEMLTIAALLHDIGKIGVPDEILRKKGKLTPKEMEKMKEHPTIGAIILQPIRGMEEAVKAVKAHQERYDGKGYPDGLRGTEIPLMARIIAVADTFDAMTTDRTYRKRLPDSVALAEIEECAGTQLDPVVVQAFFRAYKRGSITMRPVEAAEMLG